MDSPGALRCLLGSIFVSGGPDDDFRLAVAEGLLGRRPVGFVALWSKRDIARFAGKDDGGGRGDR